MTTRVYFKRNFPFEPTLPTQYYAGQIVDLDDTLANQLIAQYFAEVYQADKNYPQPYEWLGANSFSMSLIMPDGTDAAIGTGANKGIYLPVGWNSTFKSKLALSGSQLVQIAMVGDSLTAGQFSSNLDTKSLAGLLRTYLQGLYGNGGSGFKSSYESVPGFSDATYTNSVAASSLIASTGTWTYFPGAPEGPGGNVLQSIVSGSTLTYTINGDTARVYVLESTATTWGSYAITIDGVSRGTFSTGSKAAQGLQVQSFSGLGPGNHTVVLTTQSTADIFFVGMAGYNSTGVAVNKFGRGGYPSAAFNNGVGNSFVNSAGVTIGGPNRGTFAQAGRWSGGSLNRSDLIIYATGLNDARPAGATTLPDTYLANLRNFLEDVKGGGNSSADSSVMIVMQHQGDISFQEASTQYYVLYCQRIRALAEHYGAALVNFNPIGKNSYQFLKDNQYLGAKSPAGTYNPSELVHLSDAGFQWQFNTIAPLLTI